MSYGNAYGHGQQGQQPYMAGGGGAGGNGFTPYGSPAEQQQPPPQHFQQQQQQQQYYAAQVHQQQQPHQFQQPQQQQQQQQQQQFAPRLSQEQMAYGSMQAGAAFPSYQTNGQQFGATNAGGQYGAMGGWRQASPQQQQQQQQHRMSAGQIPVPQQQQPGQMYQMSPMHQQHQQQTMPSPQPRSTPTLPQSPAYRIPQSPQQQHQQTQYLQQQQQLHQQRQHPQRRLSHAQLQQPVQSPIQQQLQLQLQQQQQHSPVQPQRALQQQQAPQPSSATSTPPQHALQPQHQKQQPVQHAIQQQPQPVQEAVSQAFQQQHQQPSRQPSHDLLSTPIPESTPNPGQEQPMPLPAPEQMHFVNLQDIQQVPNNHLPSPLGSIGTDSLVDQPVQDSIHAQLPPQGSITVKPMDIMVKPMDTMLNHASASPLAPPPPVRKTSTGSNTPQIKPSPRSSVSNSPALTARSPSITKRSPALSSKSRPVVNTTQLMSAVAEECFDKARGSAHDVAMSLDPSAVEEYQKLITTGLACLEAVLQSNRLPPREEARVRLRYAAVVLEETDNLMEAEMALTKGITLCDKHRLFDLKYCMQYTMLKVLFQRSHKAALNAVDRHISDCETFKHIHWLYAFRFLKATFYMEVGQTADAGALDNIRSIQTVANSRGDNAISTFASILEGLTLLKTAKEGNVEKVQACIAQAAKFQLDPSVHVMQLDILTLLLDLASSINYQMPDVTSQKLRLLQKRLDECGDWHNVKSDFLLPVRKQPSTAQTLSQDTMALVRMGDAGAGVDFLVMSFMTKMELTSLVFTLSGLTNLHKSSSNGRKSAEFWREGLKILDAWDTTTAGIRYGPDISLQEAVRQREWRLETQAYLNVLLGLYSASHCQWSVVKQCAEKLETLIAPTTPGVLRLLAVYLSGVYRQGTGDLASAMSIFQSPSFSLSQRGTGIRATHRDMAMLAALNRLWIMQHPAHRDETETLDLIEQLQPLCRNHTNVDLRTAWHNVMAALVTDPPQQLNQQKQHIQAAMGGSKSTNNVLGAAVTLAIMRSRLFENVIGEQALKSAMAAAKQAQRSGNMLWQSVADGMLAHSYEVQGQGQEAAREWDKATQEARAAFSGN